MGQYYLAIGALVALALYLLQKYYRKTPYWDKYGIKTVPMENLILRVIKGTPMTDTILELYNKTGDDKFVGFQEAGANIVFIKDLELTKHVYIKDFDHFVDRRPMDLHDKNWNLVVTNKNGQAWKDLRATMSPVFSSGKIRRMFPIMKKSADKFVEYATNKVKRAKDGQLDIEEALGRYTMDSATTVGLGIDCEIFKEGHSFIATEANKLTLKFSAWWFLQMFFFSFMPKWMQKYQPELIDQKATKYFNKMMSDIIKHREKSGERHNDFIDLMLDAKKGQLTQDEEDLKLSLNEKDSQLQDKNRKQVDFTDELILANCMIFLFAGLDTTRSTATFAAYSLALNPHVREKLRKELQNAVEKNGGELNYDICNQLEYLDHVINETLRMYPPGRGAERLCTKDYRIPNTDALIPKGTIVQLPVYMYHYDEKYFPSPEIFDPDRFNSEVKATRSPYAFAPFGHGPRNCIASRFALVQSKVVIANLVLNFDVEPSEKTLIPMKFMNSVFTRPAESLHLKLTPTN